MTVLFIIIGALSIALYFVWKKATKNEFSNYGNEVKQIEENNKKIEPPKIKSWFKEWFGIIFLIFCFGGCVKYLVVPAPPSTPKIIPEKEMPQGFFLSVDDIRKLKSYIESLDLYREKLIEQLKKDL